MGDRNEESSNDIVDTKQDANKISNFLTGLIKRDTQKSETTTAAPPPYSDTYKMNHSNRGTAIIFNHVNFSNPKIPRRDGSDKDKTDLIDIFMDLGFQISDYDDLTANQVEDALYKASLLDYTDSDCLVIVVMSHGDNGIIYAKDKDYPTKKLWEKFSAKNCPSLAGKPKLLFIQACRGVGLHPSHLLHYTADQDETDITTDSHIMEAYYSIPVMADILVMYSTMEGYYSWRDPRNGTYFIQSLVKQLRRHSNDRDLLTILTFVNREVAIDFVSPNEGNPRYSGQKQMCSIVSMLTRLLYFHEPK